MCVWEVTCLFTLISFSIQLSAHFFLTNCFLKHEHKNLKVVNIDKFLFSVELCEGRMKLIYYSLRYGFMKKCARVPCQDSYLKSDFAERNKKHGLNVRSPSMCDTREYNRPFI